MKEDKCGLWHRWLLSMALLTTVLAVHADESERLFKVFDSSDGLADNGAQFVLCTKTGRMVINSIGHINFYNGSSFEHIDPLQQDIYELPNYTGYYHLYFDKKHHLWVKDKKQVTCVDLMTEQFVHDVRGELQAMGFTGKADDLFVDDDGCVLVMSGNKLHNLKNQQTYPVRNGKRLQDIGSVEDQMVILFYDDSSIEAFNHETGAVIYIKTALSSDMAEKYKKTSVLCNQPMGFYQIRCGDAGSVLMHIASHTGEASVVMEVPYRLNNMAVHDDLLYIASSKGYWTFNIKTGEKNHYEKLTRIDHQVIETSISDISFDLQGGMWIGTGKRGLLYSKPYTPPFKVYFMNDPKARQYSAMLKKYAEECLDSLPRRVNCLFRDSRGWRWEGSNTGLRLYMTDNAKPIVYTDDNGLNNDVIHSIVEDSDHNIWVSTSHGICALVISKGIVAKIVCYDADDNIPNGTFDNGLAMKLEDGTIIMQSQDYVIEFNPSNFHTTKRIDIKLYPKLIRLSVNGRNIQPGMLLNGKMILDRAITRAKELNLNYDQNTIGLLFTGLNYFRPVQTYYRVRVKGFQDEWQIFALNDESGRVDNKGMLHYPIFGIQPGKYVIEVQASMSPDVWEVEPYEWILVINEPWWRMTIVYASLGLLLLGLLIANFVYFNRNTRLKLSRSNIEGGVIKRVMACADICCNMENEELSPLSSELSTEQDETAQDRFADIMLKIIPYVKDKQSHQLTMVKLSELAQVDVDEFFQIMSGNLYKSPRIVALKLRLQHVAEMLKNSEKSVDEIAEELHFASPNFMIASFYHLFRMTPDAYRANNPR